MNTQQRNQERIRMWELDREAAISQCAMINNMRLKGFHWHGSIKGAVIASEMQSQAESKEDV